MESDGQSKVNIYGICLHLRSMGRQFLLFRRGGPIAFVILPLGRMYRDTTSSWSQ